MVFYYFGPDRSSWAVGNDRFSFATNLPPPIQNVWDTLGEPFQDKQMAGTSIQWISATPSGSYAIMSKNGSLHCNIPDLLSAVKNQMQLQPYGTSVEHISLSPLGGWFIRYADATVQISGKFPDSAIAILMPYLNIASPERQRSAIKVILCGFENQVVVSGGDWIKWDGLPKSLADLLTSFKSDQLTNRYDVGDNSTLSPWSKGHYFVEAKPSLVGQSQFPYSLPDLGDTKELFTHIVSNVRPPQHLIPKSSPVTPTHVEKKGADASPRRASQPQLPPRPAPQTHNSNPFRSSGTVSSSILDDGARKRYEEQFHARSGGRQSLTGSEAVEIMMQSGLPTEVLSDIWDIVDIDKNGQLDKEEFVQAMRRIDARRGTAETPAARETEGHITCDGCHRGICIGEVVHYCSVCNGGDFDLCTACNASTGISCQHQRRKLQVRLAGNPEPSRVSGTHAICDGGCGTKMYNGEMFYWCKICNGGDYGLCEACWRAQKTCGHQLVLRKLEFVSESGPQAPALGFMDLFGMSSPYGEPTFSPTGQPANDQPTEIDKLSKKFNDTRLKESLESSILTEKPNIKWDDVAGLESAKAELQEAIIFPIRFPQMFRGKRRARRALLLYGPPGTGKSYLAKAVATEVDHTLFSISSSDIMSKWIGESEGLMRALFKLAREKKPSIIFIDEIDAICGKRDGGGANGEDTARMKTEFLVQMDGVGNNNDGVFVLAATNLPWSLDPAVRRRFQKRIHVPLPDEKARKELFKVHTGDMAASLGDTELAFADLSRRTDGYSGSDIANMVQDALMMPIKKVYAATHFIKFRDHTGEWYTPCHPTVPGAQAMKWNQVPGKQLKEPPLSMQDLFAALSNVKPSVGQEEVKKCEEWTQQYGLEGA